MAGRQQGAKLPPSGYSTKQIARAAADGKKVTFYFAPDHWVSGFVCGHDDFHWGLVVTSGRDPDGNLISWPELHLVHKGQAGDIRIHEDGVLGDLDSGTKAVVERYVKPYVSHLRASNLTPQERSQS